MAEKLARSTFESDDSDDAPASLNPGPRTTIESNPLGAFRPTREAVVEGEEFHLVGFEPAYGYRRHGGGQDGREEEEEEEEDDFLAWARIIGQGEGRETSSPSSNSNQHRRLGWFIGNNMTIALPHMIEQERPTWLERSARARALEVSRETGSMPRFQG